MIIGTSTNPNVNNANRIGTSGSAQPKEKTAADKLLGDNFDPKLRERVLNDLNKFPQGALEKLTDAGWTVRVVDNKESKDGAKEGGKCRPEGKIVEVDRAAYEADKNGKVLLHEMAHAIDFKGFEAPKGLLGRMLSKVGVNGNSIFASDTNAQLSGIYQKFQAQNLVGLGTRALNQVKETSPEATSTGFITSFQGKAQVNVMEGKLVVAVIDSTSADQAKRAGVDAPKAGVSTMEINGAEVKTVRANGLTMTALDLKDADKMSTSWTQNDNYVASSNLPSELYAEGVAAFLGSQESREALLKQSPEMHAFVQNSMNEFLIADHR